MTKIRRAGPRARPARALLAGEELLAAHPLGTRSVVLRLSALYGPGRLPRTDELRAGTPLAVAAGSRMNLIDVDDAAGVILAAERLSPVPRLYVVSDGQPVDRRTCLSYLAELLGVPPPEFCEPEGDAAPPRRRGGFDQACPQLRGMMRELGIALCYPSCREGFAASIPPPVERP